MASDLPDPLFSPGAPIPSLKNQGEAQAFDLWRLYTALIKRLWLVGVVFIITVTAVAFWTFRQVRVYRAEATIVIDQTPPQVLKNNAEVVDLGSNFWSTKEYFETQYNVMRSRSVAEKVVARLALDRDYDFLHIPPSLDPAAKARVLKSVDPVEMVIGRIMVVPVKDSRVVRIAIEDTTPQRAADLANAVAEEYIEQNVDRKLSQTHGASIWLAKQLADMRKKLEDSERALYTFKKTHGVLSTSLEARQNIASDRLVQVADALTKTELRMTELSARQESLQRILKMARSRGEFVAESFKPVSDNSHIGALKTEYFRLQGERALLAERYKDDYPKVKTIDERLAKLRGDIAHEIEVVLRASEEEYRQGLDAQHKQQAMLAQAKKDALAVNSLEVEWEPIKRDKDSVQNQYEALMKRQKEVDIAGLLRTNNIRMLDPALVPKFPSRPNRAQNIALAALIGLILGIAFVIALEFLDSTVKSQDDVEGGLGLPLLGILPTIPNIAGEATSRDNTVQRDLYVGANPKSSISECARAIRTSLLFSSPDRPFKILLVASCGPREGKSTCAVSIGITMAQSGNRVLLVDGDLRRPRLHRTFGAPSQSGLSTLILGEATPEEAIKSTGVERLFLLPAGPVPPNPAELLQSARYQEVMRDLSERFDRIIIDSPPVGVVTDALVMSAQADGVVMVLRAGVTPKKAAARGRRTLLDVKAHIYGAVLNDVDLGSRVGQYYYYYRYGYYPSDKYPTTNPPSPPVPGGDGGGGGGGGRPLGVASESVVLAPVADQPAGGDPAGAPGKGGKQEAA